jgi:hypothetical protein
MGSVEVGATGSDVPSSKDIGAMELPSQMDELLARDDLRLLSHEAWFAAVSLCTSGMLLVEYGEPDGEKWARLLIRVIDEANSRGTLSKKEIISRRMRACVAAINYFGVRADDPLCDPRLIFSWLTSELGSQEELISRFTKLSSMRLDSASVAEFSRLSGWQTGVISALQKLGEIEKYVTDPELKAELHAWYELSEELSKMQEN